MVAVNPDTALLPLGEPQSFADSLPTSLVPLRPGRAFYHASGRLAGTLPEERVLWLWQRFSGDHWPDFVAAVCCLLARYGHTRVLDTRRLPSAAVLAARRQLHELVGSSSERFAGPLSVDEDVTAYTTRCDSDAQFGAHQDAFARQWRGASVATPPNNKDSPAKAVRWAISSAGSTYAAVVATVLVVPITDAALQAPNNGRGLLDHPMVFKIGRASQGKLKPGAVSLLLVPPILVQRRASRSSNLRRLQSSRRSSRSAERRSR